MTSAEEAQAIFDRDQRAERVASCIQGGWRKWEELGRRVPDLQIPLNASARAIIVHNHITDLARKEFADDYPSVQIADNRGFLTLTFEDKVVIRFKKFRNKNFVTSGIPTVQQQQYQLQFEFPDLPQAATKLVAGYLLNRLQTSVETVAVTCSIGSDVRWILDITGETDIDDQGLEPPVRSDGPRGPRVGPKPSEQQDEERSR